MEVDSVERKCRRLEERLRVLSDASRRFAEAVTDPRRVLEAVAERVALDIGDVCIVLELSDDGTLLSPVAVFDADPDVILQARAGLQGSFLIAERPLARHVLETGEPMFVPSIDLERLRPPVTAHASAPTIAWFSFLERIGADGLINVALRVHDKSLGLIALVRFRRDRAPFDVHDLELAQSLAGYAALALSNARLLTEARRETAERTRLAERLRILSEAASEFSAATYDHDQLLEIVARRLGELVGDMCGIRTISADGEWLEPSFAVYHRDSQLLAATREVGAIRQRVGQGLWGKVAATGKAHLIPTIHTADFVAATEPKYRAFLEQLAVTSAMAVPLLCRGKVVGVASLLRGGSSPPYTEDDLGFVQSIADHAALAIGNARAYASERAARTDAERANVELQHARSRFATLRDCGLLGVVVADLNGRVSEVNDTLLALVGHSRAEIMSGAVLWSSLTPPEWLAVDERAREQLVESGLGALREKEYLRKDGTRVPVLIGSAMLEGNPREVIAFVLDLTERKAAQSAIAQLRRERAADAKFRFLLESAPDAMVIEGESGRISFVNEQAEKLFGYDRSELVGQPMARLLFAAAGEGTTLRGRRKDATRFSVEISRRAVETEDGRLVSHAIRDLTEREAAEEHRAHLAAIVAASDDAIIGKSLNGTIASWNRGAENLFGYAADQIVGQSIGLIIPPGREGEEAQLLACLAKGEAKHLDTVRRRKDGTLVDVSVTASPVRDATGRVVGISKVARDIGERLRAASALAAAKDAAEGASRELEAFSYSVAHDLRAPLRGMNGFAQVLLEDYADRLDADGRDCLEEIRSNAQKMGELIDALLALSRVTRGDVRPQRVDLSELFRTVAAQHVAADPSRKVSVVVADHIVAEVDLPLARALLTNLVANAWKFTSGESIAHIEFGSTNVDGHRTLFVRDNGAGFDMAHASKLFAPFQRLHTVAEFAGTGIGLATVQRIVHRHGGRVWAEGKVGEGAVVYFTLPSGGRDTSGALDSSPAREGR